MPPRLTRPATDGLLVDPCRSPADFRRRHSRLPRPVAARGLGLLERPVHLAEPDVVADRQEQPRRPAGVLAIRGTIGPAAATWFRDRVDEAHLAAGDLVLLSSPGGDFDQAMIMGEFIRSRGLATAVGIADASGRIQPAYCASACVLRLCRRQTRFWACSKGSAFKAQTWRPPVCHNKARRRPRRRNPAGHGRGPGLHDQNGRLLLASWRRCRKPGTSAGSAPRKPWR